MAGSSAGVYRRGASVRFSADGLSAGITGRNPADGIGEVVGLSRDRQCVYVLWPGRTTPMRLHVSFVEVASPFSDIK